MIFETALRLTECGAGLAIAQATFEHFRSEKSALFALRLILAGALAGGVAPPWPAVGLVLTSVALLVRFDGPYNGGSDRMTLLVLLCAAAARVAPTRYWQELALGYLAAQLILSYAVSGWVKLVNPAWRSGRALQEVLSFSAYPASEHFRQWAAHPRLLRFVSWGVIGFELALPLAFLTKTTLIVALGIAAAFHFSNACLLGLNRFLWIWLAAYPALWWLHDRLLGP